MRVRAASVKEVGKTSLIHTHKKKKKKKKKNQ